MIVLYYNNGLLLNGYSDFSVNKSTNDGNFAPGGSLKYCSTSTVRKLV